MALMKCATTTSIPKFDDVKPGQTLHLSTPGGCRAFVIASAKRLDPVTGRNVWTAMEIGDEVVVPGAESPFTGVVIHLDVHAVRMWHIPS